MSHNPASKFGLLNYLRKTDLDTYSCVNSSSVIMKLAACMCPPPPCCFASASADDIVLMLFELHMDGMPGSKECCEFVSLQAHDSVPFLDRAWTGFHGEVKVFRVRKRRSPQIIVFEEMKLLRVLIAVEKFTRQPAPSFCHIRASQSPNQHQKVYKVLKVICLAATPDPETLQNRALTPS